MNDTAAASDRIRSLSFVQCEHPGRNFESPRPRLLSRTPLAEFGFPNNMNICEGHHVTLRIYDTTSCVLAYSR